MHRSSWAKWLPALVVVVVVVVVAAIGPRDRSPTPAASVTAPATRSLDTSGSAPPATARAVDDPCAALQRALIELVSRDPSTGPPPDQTASSGAATVRSVLPPELRAAFDRWWTELRAEPGTDEVAPVPEIDAWFVRTCSGRGP